MSGYRRFIPGLVDQRTGKVESIEVTSYQDLSPCPACDGKRRHTDAELRYHHPLSGHGYTKEQGWTFDRPEDDYPDPDDEL